MAEVGRGGGGAKGGKGGATRAGDRDRAMGGGRQSDRGGGGRDVVGGKAVAGRSQSAPQSRPTAGGGVRGAGGYMSPTGRLAQRADVQAATGGTATNTQADAAARAWADRVSDYRNTYNSPIENVGNFFGSLLGFNERPASFDPSLQNTNTRTDWGYDPAGAIGGALGMGIGVPFGTGLIADQVSSYFGRPLEMNMGPDVFGGSPYSSGLLAGQTAQGGNAWNAGNGGPQWGQGGVMAPQQAAAPSIPGAAPNSWAPPPATQMPSPWAPQWGQSNGLLSGNDDWSWGKWR